MAEITKPVVPAIQDQAVDPSVPAKTTMQQDLTAQGQRGINLIWETTQARIALRVVTTTLAINGSAVLMLIALNRDITAGQTIGISFLNFICGIVIGFYFSRTNHEKVGGSGAKPENPYVGR